MMPEPLAAWERRRRAYLVYALVCFAVAGVALAGLAAVQW